MVFNVIREDFRELRTGLRNLFFYRRMSFKMSLAIRLADIKQKAYNKQHHVMLLELGNTEKLVAVSRDDINRFKVKRWIPRHISMFELQSSIFYSTPVSRNNKSTSAERRRAKEKYLKYARRYLK